MPSGFVDNVLTFSNGLFNSFAPYIAMIVGVILAALVLEIIIGALKK